MIEITESDEALFRELADKRVITNEYAKKFYNGPQYLKKRLFQLSDSKYIIRDKGMITLASKGEEYVKNNLGLEVKPQPKSRPLKKRNARITDLMLNLSPLWKITPSWDIKKENKEEYDRNAIFNGYAENNKGDKYILYDLSTYGDVSNKKRMNKIKTEIDNLREKGENKNINLGVCIFADTDEAILAYGIDTKELPEYLIVPFNRSGFNILNAKLKFNIVDKGIKLVYKNYAPPHSEYSDATVEGKQVYMMALYDIEKLYHLKTQLQLNSPDKDEIIAIIICLENQVGLYRKLFGKNYGVEIKPINEEDLLEEITQEQLEEAQNVYKIALANKINVHQVYYDGRFIEANIAGENKKTRISYDFLIELNRLTKLKVLNVTDDENDNSNREK
jgi:hypothetical protein